MRERKSIQRARLYGSYRQQILGQPCIWSGYRRGSFPWSDHQGEKRAGAILYVVLQEMISESRGRGHQRDATFGAMLGFLIMILLDSQ